MSFLRTQVRTIAAAALTAALGAVGCSPAPGSSQTIQTVTPNFAQFVGDQANGPAGVHTFLEKQCGTLDCHGEVGRPFRLYSSNGLRLANDAGLVSGSGNDSTDELFANYLSAVEVEPEQMTRVVQGADPPTKLLLVAKPMGLERHKGGTRILLNDSMYVCLTSWLTSSQPGGFFNRGQCEAAAALQ